MLLALKMKKQMISILYSFTIILYVQCSENYKKYQVFEVTPKTTSQLDIFQNFDHDDNYDFWTHPTYVNKSFRIMVAPVVQENFVKALVANDIEYTVLISDVQSSIEAENEILNTIRVAHPHDVGDVTFDHYMHHHEMNSYLKKLAENYPETVKLIDFGTSYEGREMLLVEISTNHSANNKPVILVDAGIHAREWIAPAVALYLIYQLVENPTNAEMLKNVDWAIMPLLNPDGYEYTQTGDRLWRKTRTPPQQSECWGVDGNRNFDFQWMVAGASDNECSSTYAGPKPFSEVECKHLADYLQQQDNIKLYLTLHSYGPLLLYPFGHTTDPADNYEELDTLAQKVKERIEAVNGTQYVYGSSSTTLYAVSGSSRDYAKGAMNISLSYTIELPPGGSSGFNPPANRIISIAEETFEGFKAYQEYVEEKYNTTNTND